jgi:hypothetical protein
VSSTSVRRELAVIAVLVASAACSGDDGGSSPSTTVASVASGDTSTSAETTTVVTPAGPILFSAQGNDLDAYDLALDQPVRHTVIRHRAAEPEGWDVNGQVCTLPDGRIVAGEDTGQPDPPPGWGIFEFEGRDIASLTVTRVGRLAPTYQGGPDGAENYGCAVLPDGRVLTTDVGNQASGAGTGQLILWFPPFDVGEVRHCKLDVAVATAQQIAVDPGGRILVASSRPPTIGVLRYTGDLPTDDTAVGGCGRTDPTGAPLVDEGRLAREVLIAPGHGVTTTNGLAWSPSGTLYVSSVLSGAIDEYTADGTFLRAILRHPEGESLGERPFSTGTPLGLAVGPDGTLYFADIGLGVTGGTAGFGPVDGAGSVRRIRFAGGEPQAPETLGSGLDYPDGLGVWLPGSW